MGPLAQRRHAADHLGELLGEVCLCLHHRGEPSHLARLRRRCERALLVSNRLQPVDVVLQGILTNLGRGFDDLLIEGSGLLADLFW